MTALKSQLDRIDLNTDTRNTLAAVIRLLTPHVPYSLHILGAILNTGPRSETTQDVDPSKVSLWSTTPVHSHDISNANPHALFSIVAYSHLNHQFYFFCSGESKRPLSNGDPQREAEQEHVKHVFEHLLDIVGDAHPRYDSILRLSGSALAHRADTDSPMILIANIHAKWSALLASMTTCQIPSMRYVVPHGALDTQGGPGLPMGMTQSRTMQSRGADDGSESLQVSEIGASDVPFVYGASTIPRTDAYILSRAPYSVCVRAWKAGIDEGRPVACALMHCDGSIGALRVCPEYRRQGLGTRIMRALVERLDFGRGQRESKVIPDGDLQDLGGGALGWNWVDTEMHNEAANRFFASLVGEENMWACHWTYMPVKLK